MSKIYFTAFSQAYYVDTNWGFGCPSGGIKRMGDIFHNYNIPMTWLVSPKSARCEQEMLTKFHEEFGDEVAMMIRFSEKHHSNERSIADSWDVSKYKKIISNQKKEIENYLPWANIRVAGQGIKNQNMFTALEELGFIGMFGHCYCQIGTDSITDFGMPWGSFPMRPGEGRIPANENETGLIAFEWTMRDLNRSFHTVFPELWSTDPNDVERGGVCTDENVEWWKNMFMQYERALPLNPDGIWFQFHQEAHEMTWGEVCHPFTEERVMFTADMMDSFLEWVTERENVEFVSASRAAEIYKKKKPNGTIPMYIPYAWTTVPEELPFWEQIRTKTGYSSGISKHAHLPNEVLYDYLSEINNGDPIRAMKSPPWMDSFFYYDHECQMVFDIGRTHPIAIMNYLNYEPDPELLEEFKDERGGGVPGFYLEEKVPVPEIDLNDEILKIEVTNSQEKEIPYGILLWENKFKQIYKLKSKIEVNQQINSKWIPEQGFFIRFNLKAGKNIIQL